MPVQTWSISSKWEGGKKLVVTYERSLPREPTPYFEVRKSFYEFQPGVFCKIVRYDGATDDRCVENRIPESELPANVQAQVRAARRRYSG